MKRIMTTLAIAAFGISAMMAQSHEVTTTDKNGNKVVYEISDAPATKGDTLSITTFDPKSVAKSDSINGVNGNRDYVMTKEDMIDIIRETGIQEWGGPMASTAIGGMILGGFICVFLPIVIIVAVLLYRYFNRKKKYELAQKIVESGQPLPENFAKAFEEDYGKVEEKGLYEQGVRNIAIGIALCIFLYLITDTLFIACIGLFVIANGVSQLLSYNHRKSINYRENSNDHTNNNIVND